MLSFAAVLFPAVLTAQSAAGKITGKVLDAKTGTPLTDVAIQVVGTTGLGTMSGLEGRYVIMRAPAGTTTLSVRRLGYQPKTITGIMVPANGAVEQDIALTSADVQLQAVTVTAAAEKGSVSKALDEQRTSNAILNSTTSEQIAKSPDGDAAAAVKRVSGVTVQDGKYVFVRGLGERYTQTSLNGARVPSPEPEKKMVPLDLFPAGLLDAITTSKTFTPDQPGDFSGALVDIRTKDFPGRRQFGFSTGGGLNTGATAQQVLVAPTTGSEWLALAGSERNLPGVVDAAGNLRSVRPGAQTNSLLSAFRNSWSPTRGNAKPNGSLGMSYGGEDVVLGRRLGYVGSLSYSSAQEVRLGERVASPRADGKGGAAALNDFAGETGRSSVLYGGMLNLSTWLGQKSRVTLANTYNRTADNEAQQLQGYNEDFARTIRTSRLSFVQRSVLSNQLRGEHVLGSRHFIDWSTSRSEVNRDEPDRADLNYWEVDKTLQWKGGANDATRTFSKLNEHDFAGALNYKVILGRESDNRMLKVGAYSRNLERTSDVRSYDFVNLRLDAPQLRLPAEQLFDGRYFTNADTNMLVRPSTFGGQYRATEALAAGYAMMELPLGEQFKLVGGARVERANIDVRSVTPQGLDTLSRLRNTDVLPSLALTWQISPRQNLRVSASQTLSRPEYRELSPVAYLEIGGNNEERGNPGLKRALIQNYDVRWELYPGNGEVLSFGVFAKEFSNPIERVLVATTGKPQTGFTNAESARNYGAEVDLRKNLGSLMNALQPFTVFANGTVMNSRITITDGLTAATNPKRAMVGQAPFVVNTGLSYSNLSGSFNANLLYNVVGKRIVIAGVNPIPDTYEQPRNIVDFALQFPVLPGVKGKFTAQNLLNAQFEERTGTLSRRRYEMGRIFSAGFSLKR
jgi:outer membrane receptor for ferrienterochelin and colicin